MTQPAGLDHLPLPHPLDNVLVLHARPLRPGAVLDHTPRFRDNLWPLKTALLQHQQSALTLNFARIPKRYQLVAKELCYVMLSGELPPGEPRPAIATIATSLSNLTIFFDWLGTRIPAPGRPPIPALSELTGSDLLDYRRHLATKLPHAPTREGRLGVVRYLWRYRHHLGDALPFDPRHLDGWGEGRSTRAAENSTDRIPEAVFGPLLAWSLRFIDHFSVDILTADAYWRQHRQPSSQPRYRSRGAVQALQQYLEDHLAARQPLPGHQGTINRRWIARATGCDPKTVGRHQQLLQTVADSVGVSEHTFFPTQITATLDGQPWLGGITTTRHTDTLGSLARHLQAACYILIAFLSGMRDSEIKHLRRGCLHVDHDKRGIPYRWKVAGLAFKGEQDPAGTAATWVIGEPAARAIAVLERLQPPDIELLFAHLQHGPGYRRRDTTIAALTSDATNKQLSDLISWINDYCNQRGRPDTVPLINGKLWKLSTRQFRRTLAWFIARRPGGAIAGAIAYRHLSIQMFEGYAGTSESGFRAEVESEQALARGEHLLAMIDTHEHTNLAGPSATEAAHRLEAFGERARFPGAVITDQRRLKRLMDRHDPAIYPGKYVTCVHKHATALCQQQRDTSGQHRPDLAGCQPLSCRNVALTPDNLAAWRHEIDALDHRLDARPLLPPLLAHQLRSRRAQLAEFLNRCTPQEGT